MQYDLRIVDPPASLGEVVLTAFVLLGAIAGIVSLAARSIRRRATVRDLAVWLGGVVAGLAFSGAGSYQSTFFGYFAIGACMGAGAWVALRRTDDLRVIGLR